MFTAKQFRAKAAESAESLKHTDVPSEVREFQRSKESFSALAENEDWLANNFDKIIHSQAIPLENGDADKSVVRTTAAEIEEHILRCLGAAVIMHWNTIPTKLQRELFDTAGSMGDVLKSAALRAQIARFLHKQKDEEGPADCVSKTIAAKGTPHGA
jgi:rubrerythrin